MSDTTSDTTREMQSGPGPSSPAAESSAGHRGARLQTDRGVTTIDDIVVAKIAALAAREVEGVAQLGGNVSSTLGSVLGRIRGEGEQHQTTGVGVEVGERQAAVDLTMTASYPASIPQISDSVRQNVIDRVESLTGLEVVEVNIGVSDLRFPEDERQEEEEREREREREREQYRQELAPPPSRVE